MGPSLLVAIAIVGATRSARADRPIVVDAPGAPFAAGELADAIRVRVPIDGAAVQVRVEPIDGGVRVEARGGVRDVELGGLRGPAAARLVALATDDLLLDDLATPPAQPRATPREIGLSGGLAGWGQPLGHVTVDVSLPRGAWLAAIEVGGGELIGGAARVLTSVIRLDAGVRAGNVELRGGATAMPMWVTSGAGDRTILVGGGASLRLRLPITGTSTAVLAGGADAFATRSHYQLAGMTALVTPWLAPWLACGVEVAL